MNKWIIIFLLGCQWVWGQDICTGNLGDNIFSIGNFGSGPDNIVQTNPGIAPGYTYTTVVPPSDGFYMITNDMRTAAWDNLYGTWIKIPDNSPDPQGYMMVVNASFAPGIFYEEEVTGLCENTLYEFSADVINLIRIGVTGHHEPNLSFFLDDVEQYSSGIIPQDEEWHKHGFTFTTAIGQTSVKLSLRNNAPGGIGNDLALDNISFRPCGPSAFANASENTIVCSDEVEPVVITAETIEGASIQWQSYSDLSESWIDINGATDSVIFHDNFTPGTYLYRYLTAGSEANIQNGKCQVISDLATVTVIPIEFTIFDTICENVVYEFGTQMISDPGFYEETFLAVSGCDSFVDLFLTHVPDPGISIDFNISDPLCFGDSTGFIEVLEVNNGLEPYIYEIDQRPTQTTTPSLSEGVYTFRVEDRHSCFYEEQIDIVNPEAFMIDLGQDTSINFGVVYSFEVTTNYNLSSGSWTGAELSCEQCVENSTRPFESGNYTLSATNSNNCAAFDEIFIEVKEPDELLYKPNIFSPNDDGINDRFMVMTGSLAVQEVNYFNVFDRYGNLVYQTRNRDIMDASYGWDGKIKGVPALEGVYSYMFQVTLINGEKINGSGDLSLVR
ncbi:T9SS type B sorting domain-containing protein [Portibacter marinus]|uniref:T9SS type B sorting domain-containing protein n=1 Tax=Portibacter marinus TaxID=2898660 RepID=UPI001F44F430|nr:gliding motility-associated C-terminal domain-containing protein [Portibacter marinus]